MKFRMLALAMAGLAIAPAAQAAITFNANLAAPGFYNGTGNPSGGFTVNNTASGQEMGLRGKIRGGAVPTPVGNEYDFALGQNISYDFSYNPNSSSAEGIAAGSGSLLTLTDVGNNIIVTVPLGLIPDNCTNVAKPGVTCSALGPTGGFQNSEFLGFGGVGFGAGYHNNVNNTYRLDWTLGGAPYTDSIVLVQGRGAGAVPEPATWAMMLVGFGGLGAALRRRRSLAAFA